MGRVTKAVIPAAGLGTRFLPATKAQPKEMLPVVDRPAIQYVVEEAVKAGIDDILIITGRNKRSLEDHFDRNFELEYQLKAKGKMGDLAEVVELAQLAGPVQSARQDLRRLGYIAEVPRPGEPFVVGPVAWAHPPVTAAASALFSRPMSARATVRMCTSSGPSKIRMARCQPYIRANGKSSLTPPPPCT